MSESDPQFERRFEAANLPPGHRLRRELETELPALDAAQREFWENVLRETDRLYIDMSAGDLPEGVKERLLRLPDEPAARPTLGERLRSVSSMNVGWKTLVAAAAMVAMVIGMRAYWMLEPARAPHIPELAEPLAMEVAETAVRVHEAPPALEVAGKDGAKIESALDAHKAFPFGVKVLSPTENMNLLGGGICDFHGTPAAFTRWEKDGIHYTLYQFDGVKLGIPGSFAAKTESAEALAVGNSHPRVVIWPGSMGKCTWALVLESDAARDDFSGGYF